MKRGKDDEASIGPMFPRLHVNDTTEKGGPRAPPRNKMALYEQLSIPSQRFGSSGVTPPTTHTKPNLVSSVSSTQGSGVERHSSFPHILHQSSPKQHSHGPDETPMATVQRKKLRDEHECTVPMLLKSRAVQCHDMDSVSSISSALSGGPTRVVLFRDPPRFEGPKKAAADQERGGGLDLSNFEACLDRESECGLGGYRCVEDHSRHNHGGVTVSVRACVSLQPERVEKGGDVSEAASMLESISGLDIAPDDVVGIIGQKHFWKARKAIVNQQRVFSVQLFELHRLVKVQKLIAESPHLLLEDSAFLGQSANKTPQKFTVKALPSNDSEKPSHHKKTEFSAENLFGKPSLSSMDPPPVVTATDNNNNKADPWCFHQPPGPQWLVPVMSPSEGLVYKPYPGPGLPGSVYGPQPFGGSFGNSPYGVQAPHHHHHHPQPHPVTPHAGPAYFPHYGVAYPNPDSPQVNQLSHSQTGPAAPATGGVSPSLNTAQQSSCNVPKPPLQSGSHKLQGPRGGDLQQGSTASSPAESRGPLPLFPVGPAASEEGSRSQVADQPTRAIRVVPHSRRSATESAARIFRFIQEERKQVNYS